MINKIFTCLPFHSIPDDIPIQGPKDEAQNPGQLISISEETESEPNLGSRASIARSSKESTNSKLHKGALAGLKKLKEKTEKRDKSIDSIKNGSSSVTSTTEQLAAASKRLISKEKASSRSSMQMIITDDTVTPKLKTNSLDMSLVSNGPVSIEMTTNGNGNLIEERNNESSFNNSIDTVESLDSNNELPVNIDGNRTINTSINVDTKTHGSVQVSQV